MTTYRLSRDSDPNVRRQLRSFIADARFIVSITGAGISYASGLPLLGGDLAGVPMREFFRRTFFEQHPDVFFDVYRLALQRFRNASPNPAHHALANRDVWVITQNIDGLHRDAGTGHLIEMHGNLRELRCHECGAILDSHRALRERIPHCPHCRGVLVPGIVLEGQPIRHYGRAVDWVGRAQVLLVVGTSLSMEPVRRLPEIAERHGAAVIWVNEAAEVIVPDLLGRVELGGEVRASGTARPGDGMTGGRPGPERPGS